MAKFSLYKDTQGRFRFTLWGDEGNLLAEFYLSRPANELAANPIERLLPA